MQVKAWTGGSRPLAVNELSHEERKQIITCLEETKWFPDHDTLCIFWNRARYDAHATMRDQLSEIK